MGFASAIPPGLVAWFLVFLVLAMLLYGSVAMAVGAACNDAKDAQSLMLPVMMPLMLPMFVLLPVIESPSSTLSVGMSLLPPMTPLVMLLRVALHPAPPTWQVALGAVLTLLTTAACIWAAGRVFRVGLLAQGKSAGLGQMAALDLRALSRAASPKQPLRPTSARRSHSVAQSPTSGERDACRAVPHSVAAPLHLAPGNLLPWHCDIEHAASCALRKNRPSARDPVSSTVTRHFGVAIGKPKHERMSVA